MFLRTKKTLICVLVLLCAMLIAAVGAIGYTENAYAYTTEGLPKDDKVIQLDSADAKFKFSRDGFNALAKKAGYTDLNAMMTAATAQGTALTPKFSDTVVQLGTDNTEGGSALKWVPVYLSKDKDGNATLTLWLATDVYKSTWSDGTYSASVSKTFNGKTVYSNTYDASFIRHKLNGKTGWTTEWGSGSNQSKANDNIRTLVSDFYGTGKFASYVTTPAKVSWQKVGYMKNDPNWAGNASLTANYPCDWVNDNVWLPSIYEVNYSNVQNNSGESTFVKDGGKWQVEQGNVCVNNNGSYTWLRSGDPTTYTRSYGLGSTAGSYYYYVSNVAGVRPALHINLKSVDEATKPYEVTVGGTTTKYAKFKDAWSAANTAGTATVKMNADATVSQTLVVDKNSNITLNLHNCVLALNSTATSGSVILVNGTFTATNTSDGALTEHKIKDPVTKTEKSVAGGVITGGKGTQISSNKLGGGVYVADGGSLTMSGSVNVAGNTSDFGGGVRVNDGGSFTMSVNARIVYNKATKDGGGLCVCNAAKVELGGSIDYNSALAGGGVYFEGTASSDYTVKGTIMNNAATADVNYSDSGKGGGIYIDGCSVLMGIESGSPCMVYYNTASKQGGGIFVNATSTLKIGGNIRVESNKTGENANNIYLDGDTKINVVSKLSENRIYVHNTGAVITGFTSDKKPYISVTPSKIFKADDTANDCVWYSNETAGEVYIGHAGGTATCQSKAVCTHCSAEYGELGAHTPEADDNDCTTAIKCSVCQTVTTAAKDKHDFTGAYLKDADGHWHVCGREGCTQTDTKTAHSGGTASCTEKAKCSVCQAEYGELAAHRYYAPSYYWDEHNCIATRTCMTCEHPESETAEGKKVTVKPTCTAEGYDAWTAKFENKAFYDKTMTDNSQPALGHDYKQREWIYNTENNTAAISFDCYFCDGHFDNKQATLKQESVTLEPNCNRVGSKNCTFEYVLKEGEYRVDRQESKTYSYTANDVEIPKDENAHSWDNGAVTTPATCQQAGVKTFICKHNGKHTKTEPVALNPDAHSYDTANWTSDGTGHWHAATCGHDTEKGDFATHTASDWIVDTAAQIGVAGSKHKECTVCGYKLETANIPAIEPDHEHTFSTEWTKDESGHWHAATCEHISQKDAFATHTAGDWIIDTPAQIGIAGSKHKQCTVCGFTTETAEIPAIAPEHQHTFSTEWTKDETGHWHAATCEHISQKDGFATHTAGDWIVDTPAQIGVAGSKHKECIVCGYSMHAEAIEPLKDKLEKPSENGGENQVVVTTPEGFTPDIELVVTEIAQENYGAYESIAQTVNGEINFVYDVTLKSDGVTIQPDGTLTIKLLIPADLREKNFKLFHLHGNEATDMEYTVDGNYAVVTTDKLSEFIFVGEKNAVTPAPNGGNGLSAGAIAGITIAAIIVVLLAVYIALYFTLYRKGVLKGKAFDTMYAPMNAIFKKEEQN